MTSVLDIRPEVPAIPLSAALSRIDGAQLHAPGTQGWDTPVSGVTVSSNDIEAGWIFVAIGGLVQHGIRFAPAAVRKGAAAIVTDQAGADQCDAVDCPIVVIADPRAGAALIAAAVHGDPARDLVTMAITGTNGKTTTSYLMRAALQGAHPDPALCGTVESRIGSVRFDSDQTTAEAPVIHRLLDLARQQNLGAAVVETSAHAMSLNRVDGIVFDVAAFTNLQHDHLDYYGDMEKYYAAKKMLFTPEHSRSGVICVDDEWGRRLATETTIPVVTVAALSDENADWRVTSIVADQETLRTTLTLVDPDGNSHTVAMPVLGRVNVQNTAVAVVAAVQAGIPLAEAISAIEAAEQIPGRMEKVNPNPGNQPLVVVDMAHTPEGFTWTLEAVRELTKGRLIMVFGTDGDRDATKREELGELAAREADILWVTDENPRTEDPQSIRDYLLRGIARVRPDMHDVTEIKTCRRDAVRKAILAAQAGDVILIPGKGAEWYQDIEGIKHPYNDVPVAREVLEQDPRSKL
ncbi:MAG: UDP-N-acetylmuramoyl-L-alanyl-D-glutamate--2,6-diaminopimelate ligase [Actinomycetaceae bacterium]|nr:UDP-N-acetylmuramoyl-L-alanyl-D-glutamate--2,6-diaminopimelate ligase [Actinomycetaceae bacterium]